MSKNACQKSERTHNAVGPADRNEENDVLTFDTGLDCSEIAVAEASMESVATDGTLDSLVALRSKRLEERTAALRSRVVMAQKALDHRTTKQRAEIDKERERLRASQEALERQARALAAAARVTAVLEEKKSMRAEVDPSLGEEKSSEMKLEFSMSRLDSTQVREMLTVSLHDSTFNPLAALQKIRKPQGPSPEDNPTLSLSDRVSELLKLAEGERDSIESNEVAMESLRLEAERINASLVRRRQKHEARAEKIEEQEQELQVTYDKIRREREALAARVRDLEAEEVIYKSRIDGLEHTREELNQEALELNKAQLNLNERHRVLRETLEHERHRLQMRQAELQRKVADLAEAAREKRTKVEHAVAQQRAELEAKMKARRQEIEEAAKAELDRTAAELEQVLNLQLSEIESDLFTRKASLDLRVSELSRLQSLDELAFDGDTNAGEIELRPLSSPSLSVERPESSRSEELDLSRFDSLRNEIEALQHVKVNYSGRQQKRGDTPARTPAPTLKIETGLNSNDMGSTSESRPQGTLCPFPMAPSGRKDNGADGADAKSAGEKSD